MVEKLKTVNFPEGDVNFIVSSIVGAAYLNDPSYNTLNAMEGALHQAAKELFRRVGSRHEALKILESGDIEVYQEIDKMLDRKFSELSNAKSASDNQEIYKVEKNKKTSKKNKNKLV